MFYCYILKLNFMKRQDEYNKLTAEEYAIIVKKGTEYPGTGLYLDNKNLESIHVSNVMLSYTDLMINLILTVDGRALMMK